MLQNYISLGLFLTCFLIFIHKSRRGWITFQSWASIPAFHWPCSLWMKTMLKSFIRKTRGENQQHSERGKNSWIAEKKLEKKKTPLLALLSWRKIHCCHWQKNYSAIKKEQTTFRSVRSQPAWPLRERFYLSYLFSIIYSPVYFFLSSDDFAIVYYYWMYLLLFSSFCLRQPERLHRNHVFFLHLLLILIYIVFLWYFFIVHVINLWRTES